MESIDLRPNFLAGPNPIETYRQAKQHADDYPPGVSGGSKIRRLIVAIGDVTRCVRGVWKLSWIEVLMIVVAGRHGDTRREFAEGLDAGQERLLGHPGLKMVKKPRNRVPSHCAHSSNLHEAASRKIGAFAADRVAEFATSIDE